MTFQSSYLFTWLPIYLSGGRIQPDKLVDQITALAVLLDAQREIKPLSPDNRRSNGRIDTTA